MDNKGKDDDHGHAHVNVPSAPIDQSRKTIIKIDPSNKHQV